MSRKSKAAEFVDVGYSINVTGRNVLVTEAMKNYALDKISKIERLSQRVSTVNITMDVQKYEHRVEILIRLDNTEILSKSTQDDMYAAIDDVVDQVMEQLRRYKTRMHDHQSIGHADVALNVNIYGATDDILEVNDAIEEANQRSTFDNYRPHQIVKKETRPLKTLNVNEAIVKMEISGDAFMVFRSEEDRKLKVIYVRDDSNFGIIEAE